MNAIDILGLNIETSDWKYKDNLPMHILNDYIIKKANINDVDCIMLIPKDSLPTIPVLKKQIGIIKDVTELSVVLKLNQLSNFRRENLLANKIPFIYKDKLVYLPFLGTVLIGGSFDSLNKDNFTMSAQVLLIWILYKNSDKYFIADAVQDLPYSNMTLTRAYRQLVQKDLFEENKLGRKIYLTTKYSKKELFEKAKENFISPITKEGYLNKKENHLKMIESGDTALSKYTMINPTLPITYAIDKKNKKIIKLGNELINMNEQVKVEIWDYNPLLFSKDKESIDLISLAISLLDNKDERIEQAVNDLLMQIWE